MPARPPDARHRTGNETKPQRRTKATLALPTAAALALMFTATGAAVATAPATQSVSPSQNAAAVTTQQPPLFDPDLAAARQLKRVEQADAVVRHNQAVVRATAAARVARSAERTRLAVRAVEAKRVAQAQKVERVAQALRSERVARAVESKRVAQALKVERVARAVKAQHEAQHEAQVLKAQALEAQRETRSQESDRASQSNSWQLPITNPVRTSGFGFRWGRLHAGEDFAVSTGTDLASMSSGSVISAGESGGYGNLVKIRYWDGTVSFFAHMSSISVNPGESVQPGQIVGQSGNSGNSTGPHLHLEIHPNGGQAVDPGPWLVEHNISR